MRNTKIVLLICIYLVLIDANSSNSQEMSCNSSKSCGSQYICKENSCVKKCQNDKMCSQGYICKDGTCNLISNNQKQIYVKANQINNECVNNHCSNKCKNKQCQPGQLCHQDKCVQCISNTNCPLNHYCFQNICIHGCIDSSHCDSNSRCVSGLCTIQTHSCELNTECSCLNGYLAYCREGVCSCQSCTSHQDCLNNDFSCPSTVDINSVYYPFCTPKKPNFPSHCVWGCQRDVDCIGYSKLTNPKDYFKCTQDYTCQLFKVEQS